MTGASGRPGGPWGWRLPSGRATRMRRPSRTQNGIHSPFNWKALKPWGVLAFISFWKASLASQTAGSQEVICLLTVCAPTVQIKHSFQTNLLCTKRNSLNCTYSFHYAPGAQIIVNYFLCESYFGYYMYGEIHHRVINADVLC